MRKIEERCAGLGNFITIFSGIRFGSLGSDPTKTWSVEKKKLKKGQKRERTIINVVGEEEKIDERDVVKNKTATTTTTTM